MSDSKVKSEFEKQIYLLWKSKYRTERDWKEFLDCLSLEEVTFLGRFSSHIFKFLAKDIFIIAHGDIGKDEECLSSLSEVKKDLNLSGKDLIVVAALLEPFQNISFFFQAGDKTNSKIKVIRIPRFHVPDYFSLDRRVVSSRSLKELFYSWSDQTSLERKYLDAFDDSKTNLRDKVYLATLTLIWGLLFHLEGNEFSLSDNNIEQTEFRKITSIHLGELIMPGAGSSGNSQVKELLEEIVASADSLDFQLINYLSQYFPYSWVEPSTALQEIAITPVMLSRLFESFGKGGKKHGKYYTKIVDAEFLSFLGLYRYLRTSQQEIDFESLRDAYYYPLISSNGESNYPLPSQEISIKILDPSCGTGTFLISVANLIIRFLQINTKPIRFELHFWGVDIASLPLWIAKARITFLKMINSKKIGSQMNLPLKIDTVSFIRSDFFACSFPTSFDLIVGNPPWVRHEDIDYGIRSGSVSKSEIHNKISQELGTGIVLDKRSDLSIFFCLRALSLLNPGIGQLSFIMPISWLEVKFGQSLQNFLLDPLNHISRFEVLNWEKERLWEELGVNSVFFLASREGKVPKRLADGFFTSSSVPFFEIPPANLQDGILELKEHRFDIYRTEKIEGAVLKTNRKWAGSYLRTPFKVRRIIKTLQSKGISLGKLAMVRFGIKTGANDFFYMELGEKPSSDPNLIFVRNRLGFDGLMEKKYCIPIVKSPIEIQGFVIPNPFVSTRLLFYCQDSVDDLESKQARHLIEWGESIKLKIKQGFNSGNQIQGIKSLRSVKGRKQWYSIPETPVPDLVWTKSFHDRPGCILNEKRILADQRFYSIVLKDKSLTSLVFLYLNSSLVWAQSEIQGNTNMGFGVLDTNVYFLRSIFIPVGLVSDPKKRKSVEDLANRLKIQPKRYSMLANAPLLHEIDALFFDHFDISEKDRKRLSYFVTNTLKKRIRMTTNRKE
ncbi:MAG: Eco57I restriction-modification methylase domain-containing protein [Candidatus Heimdallarchaeota archaeon]